MPVIKSILVVGGGVSGMCAAIMLARSGCDVHLMDADENWRALGAGMTLNGGVWRAFHQMGLLEQVRAAGACGKGTKSCAADGTLIRAAPDSEPFGPGIPAIGGIMRPALHKILQAATREAGVEVALGKRLVDLDENGEGVTARFADGSSATFDIVIGADGVNSTVKSLIFPDSPPLTYSGQGCWRAVLKRPAELEGPVFFFGRQKCGLNPVSADEMYLFLLHNVPDNRYMPEERWVELLKAELEEFTAPLVRDIADNLDKSSLINYRPLDAGMTPRPWYKGRVLLIGDAAHATTPHSAYGAGLGVEDGIVIAEQLAKGGGVDEVFESFVERRYERCRAVVEGSIYQGKLEQIGAPAKEFAEATIAVANIILQPF